MLEARISQLADRFRLPADVRAALIAVVRDASSPRPAEPPTDDEPTRLQFRPVPRAAPRQACATPFDEPTQFLAAVVPSLPVRPPKDPADRYEDLGLIGTGATGEVRRVRDTDLNRIMAMKIIHAHLMNSQGVVARFVSEAQATAQLEHPGIIPVHAMGKLPDGRYYFTMKEVRGHTLDTVIADVHRVSTGGRWETAPGGWSFRRLIEAFRKVCEAVGYAHARGVVHRDLKPENIMVGPFGEVVVMDWGLAKVVGADEPADDGLGVVSTWRSRDSAFATRLGSVAGTPTYMPPEQARGAHNEIGPRADVYALGAILYEMLSGRPPYLGTDAVQVLAQVLDGPPPPPGRVEVAGVPATGHEKGPPPIPAELQDICLRAMERAPEDRYADGGQLADEIEAWLDGAKKREQAQAELQRAIELQAEVAQIRRQAAEVRAQAAEILRNIRPNEPVERKRPGWTLEDRAQRLDAKADLKEVVMTQVLQAALTFVPDLTEAHDLLGDYYRGLHADAEQRHDRTESVRYEVLLQAHDTGRHTPYLRGDGALTLLTDPPGAEVELCRFAPFDRRLRVVPVRSLGRTPLNAVDLQRGSYLLRIRIDGRVEVRYPVNIGRQEHWDGIPPGQTEPLPIYLPTQKQLGANGIYVPAGWFQAGGDPEAWEDMPRTRLWCDAFVLQRFPVTNWEYIAFLDALVKSGREPDALRRAPRERAGTVGRTGAIIYGRDTDGRFVLRQDSDGDRWEPTWPVVMVDWGSAYAFSRWYAAKSRQPWRLPVALEWEKAARGADARFYPWGDWLDPTWCCMADSHGRRPTLVPVDTYIQDESPYGVHGLGGNVRDWCLDSHQEGGPRTEGQRVIVPTAVRNDSQPRYVKGGSWSGNGQQARAAGISWFEPERRSAEIGFRLARPITGED